MWRNGADGNNYLTVKLSGKSPNTEAAGARITIDYGGNTRMREISIASNYVSQNPTEQVFGLGTSTQVDELTVQWPDGLETVLMNVQAGQSITIEHPDL